MNFWRMSTFRGCVKLCQIDSGDLLETMNGISINVNEIWLIVDEVGQIQMKQERKKNVFLGLEARRGSFLFPILHSSLNHIIMPSSYCSQVLPFCYVILLNKHQQCHSNTTKKKIEFLLLINKNKELYYCQKRGTYNHL